jgi:UDP-N-acetylmuramate--alanine ligase
MLALNNIKRVYFVGLGGIGMSALARFFLQRGVVVSGYDRTETELTKTLVAEGMRCHYTDDIALLDKAADAVIFTPAIPEGHRELEYYLQNGYQVMKRSDMLHIISKQLRALCVAGTHGKTTVSTMVAHILRDTGYGCNAFLGGISANYHSNYWGSVNEVAVIEADEYDRSFLKLDPAMSIITAMDADHLDIYGTESAMQDSYLQFINSNREAIIIKHGLPRSSDITVATKYTYSLQNDAADFYAANIIMRHGTYTFDLMRNHQFLCSLTLNVGGMHNIENMVAACALALLNGIDLIPIAHAVATYKGVKRRFEYLLNTQAQVYIDDYAHHPEELRVLIKSARALFPAKRLVIAFQPHLFSRTRDFVEGFAEVLSLADEVILLDIYPARELPISGVTSQMIADKMSLPTVTILSKEGLLEFVKAANPPLMITAGAGDIDKLVKPIAQLLLTTPTNSVANE